MNMNISTTIIDQNTLKNEIKYRRLKAIVFAVLGINVAALLMLLVQGCREEEPSPTMESVDTNLPSIVEATNSLPASTNAPASDATPASLLQTNPPSASSGSIEYIIAKGDTFSRLAKKFHISVQTVVNANPGVNPARLKVGQNIQIPQSISSVATVTPYMNNANIYVVKPGDTLNKIAGSFGITPKAIRQENDLKTNRINVGQALKIPVRQVAVNRSAATRPTDVAQ